MIDKAMLQDNAFKAPTCFNQFKIITKAVARRHPFFPGHRL